MVFLPEVASASFDSYRGSAVVNSGPRPSLDAGNLLRETSSHVDERPDILNIGGLSDQVFEIMALFARGTLTAEHWVSVIEALRI